MLIFGQTILARWPPGNPYQLRILEFPISLFNIFDDNEHKPICTHLK